MRYVFLYNFGPLGFVYHVGKGGGQANIADKNVQQYGCSVDGGYCSALWLPVLGRFRASYREEVLAFGAYYRRQGIP
jgi:hypothetical protein